MPGRKKVGDKELSRKLRRSSRKSRKSKSSQVRKNASRGKHADHSDITFDEVQSVIFDKDDWSVEEAQEWLKEHKYKAGEPDKTKTQYRFRQFEPHYGSNWEFAQKTIESATKKLPIHLNLNFNVI